MRSECLPFTQEKLSTHWKTLSSIWKGLLVALPKLVRLLLSWIFGIPQEFGSVTLTGVPISAFTSSTPANCWVMLLNRELYPKRASLTLFGANTRTLDNTHWLARV